MRKNFTIYDFNELLDVIHTKQREWEEYDPSNLSIYNTLSLIYNNVLEKREKYLQQYEKDEIGFDELENEFEKYEKLMSK